MSTKTSGIALIVVGVIVLALSLAADALGIGGSSGIGWKQLVGGGIGLLIALAGVWLTARKPSHSK